MYHIEFNNSNQGATASSKFKALNIARRRLGVMRLYRGATYQTDRFDSQGEREYVMATEYWLTRSAARQETNGAAPVVISR